MKKKINLAMKCGHIHVYKSAFDYKEYKIHTRGSCFRCKDSGGDGIGSGTADIIRRWQGGKS